MPNREQERAILRMIYNEEEFVTVIQDDCPDFRIVRRGSEIQFGVEITELYSSEAEARLSNLPGYLSHLLAGGAYRHKSDQTVLEIGEFRVDQPDGLKSVTGCIRLKIPEFPDYIGKLVESIESKNEKLAGYAGGLSHNNLVILDRTARICLLEPERLYGVMFTPEMKRAIYGSGFREIYLITQIAKNRQVYLPMKMLLLLGEFFLFGWAVDDYLASLPLSDSAEQHSTRNFDYRLAIIRGYAAWMKSKGVEVFIEEQDNSLYWGATVLRFNADGVRLGSIGDGPLPPNLQTPEVPEDNDPAFLEHLSRFLRDHTFESPFLFDTRGVA